MSRVITSPVKRWPGTVTLADPLTFPQYIAWMDAVEAAQGDKETLTVSDAAFLPRVTAAILPGICACIEAHDLKGLPPILVVETFPATPRIASGRLIAWLIGEINLLMQEAEDLPNE